MSATDAGLDTDVEDLRTVTLTVNGTAYSATASTRTLLSDFLRHDLRLTGTHVGCEHGACGACTIIVDGATVRSCLMLAVQVDGAQVTTVEGLSDGEKLSSLQEAFWDQHGLQCGFCTPGILCSLRAALDNGVDLDTELDDVLGGHLCRCTGYQNVRAAVRAHLEGEA